FSCLKLGGGIAITNILLIGRLRTSGPAAAVGASGAFALGFNQALGYGDKNRDVLKLLVVQRIADTMPKGNCVYIPSLKEGDIVHLPIGNIDEWEMLVGASMCLYCDQGYLPEKTLSFTRSDRAAWDPEGSTAPKRRRHRR